jgi:hypothetical protein
MIYENKKVKELAQFAYMIIRRLDYTGKSNRIFVNSIPKSGTHLVTALLTEVDGLKNSGVHIKTYEVNKNASKSPLRNSKFSLDEYALENILKRIRLGQVVTSHLPYNKKIIEVCRNLNYKTVFMRRNLRDILFSEYYYIKKLERHFMHDWLIRNSKCMDSGIKLLLEGDGDAFPPFLDRMERFSEWCKSKDVIQVSFEDLVKVKAGEDLDFIKSYLADLLEKLGIKYEEEKLSDVTNAIKSKGSFTMRNGKAGGWREEYKKLTSLTVEKIENQLELIDNKNF